MYTSLGEVTLKSGEVVEAGVVTGPDSHWRERVQHLLRHKGEPWDWQNFELLTHDVGVEAHFHLLHRDGVPFSNIMTVEYKGVGLFGHVWTNPEDRGQGAASKLMALQMEQFHAQGGKALYLGTGFDSQAYHIYRRHGFESIEPGSGKMSYFTTSREEFEAEYFAPGDAKIQPLDWPHWPTSAALFTADIPGTIRCAPFGLIGRELTEGPLLPPIRQNRLGGQSNLPPRAVALTKPNNGALVGLAAWTEDTVWPDTNIFDVFCHPNFQHRAGDLVAELELPQNGELIAYAATDEDSKSRVLGNLGFEPLATLPNWLPIAATESNRDVAIFRRTRA